MNCYAACREICIDGWMDKWIIEGIDRILVSNKERELCIDLIFFVKMYGNWMLNALL